MSTLTQSTGFWNNIFRGELEHNRFAIISIVLLVVGCLGGLTVGFGAIHHTWQLIMIVIPTMMTLSFLLAVAPLKQILWLATLSIIIDVLILVFNLLS